MINSLTSNVFALICHQSPERCWAPGGIAMPICQRCTGVYVGVLLAVITIIFVRCPVNRKLLVLHALLALQAIPFGLHLVPETAGIRLLSGQLLGVGIVYLLTAGLVEGMRIKLRRSCKPYICTTVICFLSLQLIVHTPVPVMAAALALASMLGLAVLICLVLVNIISLFAMIKR